MKSKKLYIAFSAIGVCLIAAAMAALASAHININSIWANAGKQNKPKLTQALSEEAIVYVNGEPIKQSSFDSYKALSTAAAQSNAILIEQMDVSDAEKQQMLQYSRAFTDDELIEKLIDKKVKLQAAEALGITVSDQEIADFFAEQEQLERMASHENAALTEGMIQSYVEGLGMTMEEYRQTLETQMTREELTIQKLVAHQLQSKNVTANTPYEQRKAILDSYFDELRSQAVIEYVKK